MYGLKLVKHSIFPHKPIYLTHNGKSGKRTISAIEIGISIRTKKPSILVNRRGKEFKYRNLSDESKRVVDKIVEHNKKYL
jgi:hypothetical protein